MANLIQDEIVTPPAVEGVEYIPAPNWTLFRTLPTFDIRNGRVEDVQTVFIRATIPAMYHWVPISGLAPADGVKAMDGFIKSHIQRVNASRPPSMTEATARKVGIALGVARAVSTTYYRLNETDLIGAERAAPVLSAFDAGDGNMRYTVAQGLTAEATTELSVALDLTDVEKAAVSALVRCAMGIIPMQGYSLLMTGHHYLSQADSQAKKVYTVAEKAYWRATGVGTWFTDDLEVIQDALWHKACHPVDMRLKEVTAMDADVAVKLRNANAGACASRLPAMETELRAANSYITLLSTVAPMYEMCNGGINMDALSELVLVVKNLPVNDPNPVIPAEVTAAWGPALTNRESGLRMLEAMLHKNQDRVAYAYGFYMGQSESNVTMGAGGAAGDDTLRTSFSLKKLKQQSFAAWTAGFAAYGDYLGVRNKRRQEGVFDAPMITIA